MLIKPMKKILLLSLIVFSLLSCNEPTGLLVEVYNPTDEVRINEMVELDYADVLHRLELTEDTSIIVLDVHGFQVYYQITFNNKLIFVPHPVGVGMTDYYRIIPGVPEHFDACAVGAHYDGGGDIAWENGRIAFCVSGPEKDVERERNCGYDVWVKRVDTPVIPQYFAGINGDSVACEACDDVLIADTLGGSAILADCYDEGASLGAGATALLDAQGNMLYPRRCEAYKILNNGPLRFTVSLRYSPVVLDGDTVVETRVITLNEACQLNKVSVVYHHLTKPVQVVTGIALHDIDALVEHDTELRYVACAVPTDSVNGRVYVGMSTAMPVQTRVACLDEEEQAVRGIEGYLLMQHEYEPGEIYTYYTGAGWSEWGFDTPGDWFSYMRSYAKALASPLRVTMK